MDSQKKSLGSDLKALYTTFDGRLSRKPFWLGILGLIVGGMVLSRAIVVPLADLSPGMGDAAHLLLSLALLHPAVALATKRLHDRDQPVALIWAFVLPGLACQVASLLGLTLRTLVMQGQTVLLPTPLGAFLGLLALATGAWALVTLGLRKGTTGPSAHGPDPLAATTRPARPDVVMDSGF